MTVDLYVGEVMHRRSRPKAYEFVYRVFNIVVDIDKLRDDAVGRRLFSYNRFNLFSFYDRDHGARDGSKLRPWVEKHLADAGLVHDRYGEDQLASEGDAVDPRGQPAQVLLPEVKPCRPAVPR